MDFLFCPRISNSFLLKNKEKIQNIYPIQTEIYIHALLFLHPLRPTFPSSKRSSQCKRCNWLLRFWIIIRFTVWITCNSESIASRIEQSFIRVHMFPTVITMNLSLSYPYLPPTPYLRRQEVVKGVHDGQAAWGREIGGEGGLPDGWEGFGEPRTPESRSPRPRRRPPPRDEDGQFHALAAAHASSGGGRRRVSSLHMGLGRWHN